MPCGFREDGVLYLVHCKSMVGIRCHGAQFGSQSALNQMQPFRYLNYNYFTKFQ